MNAFDLESSVYDKTFTHTKIGKRQRARVHKYLDKILDTDLTLDILELNCGTGEDAIHMAKFGHNIIASDKSKSMLTVAEEKTKILPNANVTFTELDLNGPFNFDQKFHLVFSNFGGLNCISKEALEKVAKSVAQILHVDGSFVAVIMPKHTLMEKWYRLFKKESQIYASRSESGATNVKVNKGFIKTYFFNPDNIQSVFSTLKLEGCISIGFVPSYLENNILLPVLHALDKTFTSFRLSPKYADHYLIHLKRVA